MPKRVVEIRVRKKRFGVVVDGITHSDRGTKYILKSLELDYRGLNRKERDAKMQDCISKLMAIN